MKKSSLLITAISILSISSLHAWQTIENATVEEIVMWGTGGANRTIIRFVEGSNSIRCDIDNEEKNLTSLALTLYTTGQKVDVICYDTQNTINGIPSYELHRLITKK